MTLSRPHTKKIGAFLLPVCLIACLAAPTSGQSDDQAALRRVVDQLLSLFQQRDVVSVMGLWSGNSPSFAANRQTMHQTFSSYGKIELKSINVNKVDVTGDRASIQLVADFSVGSVQTGASVTALKTSWTIKTIQEGGAWKIWELKSAEQELAAALSATKTLEEATALLDGQPKLVNTELVRALLKAARDLADRGQSARGLPLCDLAFSIAHRISDKAGMSMSLRTKGKIYERLGDYRQSKEYYDRSLKVAEELGDKSTLGEVFTALAIYYALQGDNPKALEFFLRDLHIREELGNKSEIAVALGNIGIVYSTLRENLLALETLQRSLKLRIELRDKMGSSTTLLTIGNLYLVQGNYPQALEYLEQSLKIKQEIGDRAGIGIVLSNSASIYGLQGDYVRALDYMEQALKISEELEDKRGTAEVLHNIAFTHYLKGDYSMALEQDLKVLKRAEELAYGPLLAQVLQYIGGSYLRLGNYQLAIEYADRALAVSAKAGLPEIRWISRNRTGKAHLALNQPDKARQDFLEAIATIEKLRGQVAGGEQEAQLFFEDKIAPYHGMIELALAQNDPAQALSYAERAKGRVLLDVLRSGRAQVTKAMTSAELDRDRALVADITSLNTQLGRLGPSKSKESQQAEITTQLDKARLEYEAFQAGLYAAHPELKVKRGQTPLLTLDEAAELLPNRQTAILEYVVTEDKTYLFVLRKAAGADVTGKAPVELTVYPINIKSKELSEMAESFRQNVAERNLTVKTPAGKLYELLIKPAEKQLRDVRRLCIVPDGSLWNLPFQALHQEAKGYLLEQYALFYAPSLSVLREMGRRATALRAAHRLPPAATGVTAQPSAVISDQTELLALGNPALSGETVSKARLVRRDEPLSPLPDAEKEVTFLGRLYGPGHSKVLIGEQAKEATVKAEAGKYDVIHFATHAVLDDRNPLYSRIILSRAEGDDKEDGLLEAWEIMKLDLDAELAILSACETARGRVAAGEGVVGMSWALFVAGSPAAVVSQWKVDSARSADLMIEFHRNLRQKQRDGRLMYTRSESLRQAALKLLHGPYNHPAYWAAFILIGDDR